MSNEEKKQPEKKRDEALVERLFRRMFEGVGAAMDRKLGREGNLQNSLTTTRLVDRMKRLIDERARDDSKRGGRIAPHHLKLKIEWGTHSEAPPESVQELEHEVLAAAIDYINDARLRTLAPVSVETMADIFTTGIAVDPSFGEFEEELQREDEERRQAELAEEGKKERGGVPLKGVPLRSPPPEPETIVTARATLPDGSQEHRLSLQPGGRRLNVGRAADNDLCLPHQSVSKIHAALVLNREGTLLIADTGSTNGTFINGRRIAYTEARQLEDGDVVGFGDVEVRFRKNSNK